MSRAILGETRARYSVDESAPDEPSAEHYAAARRWLACAREARGWALEASPGTASYFWARVCEALVRADAHRELARRWRPSDPATRPVSETAWRQERAAESLRRALSIDACYAAARRALRLARVFRCEPGSTGRRERECVDQVVLLRRAILELRAEERLALEGPGLRKTTALGLPSRGAAAVARGRASG
jgi:hypothetical protein